MRRVVELAKALAERNRLRALHALRGRELCVCQIVALLELAPSTVSKHMSILRRARLVESRKKGRWVHYRLAGKDAPSEAAEALDWALQHLSGTGQARKDAARLEEILNTDPQQLCALREGK